MGIENFWENICGVRMERALTCVCQKPLLYIVDFAINHLELVIDYHALLTYCALYFTLSLYIVTNHKLSVIFTSINVDVLMMSKKKKVD